MNTASKTIHLLRHAAKDFSPQSDFLTPLTRKGQEQAAKLGMMLKESAIKPDLILCSPSLRTRQTRDELLKAAEFDHSFASEENYHIYEGRYSDIFNQIQKLPQSANSVLLIGHNPQIPQLISFLASDASVQSHFGGYVGIEPCTLTSIDICAENWQDIQPNENMVMSVLKP